MIPKKIHYCWFGGKTLPLLAQTCIKSWKKYCPDYELVRWDEDSFDIHSAPLYVQQAYQVKKWAFVTDYVRLYAMVNYGGIYMDTDVEVIKPLDKFLDHRAFSGFEDEKNIPTGIMASEKDFALFKQLLNYYDDALFINDDGSYNTKTNVETITEACLEKGLMQNNTFQIIDGFALYSNDVFCPKSYVDGIIRQTDNTVCIHHFNGSWFSDESKEIKKLRWQKEKRKYYKKKIDNYLKQILGGYIYNSFKKIYVFLRVRLGNKNK